MKSTELWFLILTISTVHSAESSYISRLINGEVRHCIGIHDCPPGHEILPCSVDYTEDQCSQCSDGFVQPDYISSAKNTAATKCFKPQGECHARDVVDSRTPNTNSCDFNKYCKCDMNQCYFGDPCHCQKRHKPCDIGETMNTAGECVTCPLGTEKDTTGCGHCKRMRTKENLTKSPSTTCNMTTPTTPKTIQELTDEAATATPTTTSDVAFDQGRYVKSLPEQLNQKAGTEEPQSPLMIIIGALSAVVGMGIVLFIIFLFCKNRKTIYDTLQRIEEGPLLPNQNVNNVPLKTENNVPENQQNQPRKNGSENQGAKDNGPKNNAPDVTVTDLGSILDTIDVEENIENDRQNNVQLVQAEQVSDGSLLINFSQTPSIQTHSSDDFENTETSLNSKDYAKGTITSSRNAAKFTGEQLNNLQELIVKLIDEQNEKYASLQNGSTLPVSVSNRLQEDKINPISEREEKAKLLPTNKAFQSQENMSSIQNDIVKIVNEKQDCAKPLPIKKAFQSEENISSIQHDIVKIVDEYQDKAMSLPIDATFKTDLSSIQKDIVKTIHDEHNDSHSLASKAAPTKKLNTLDGGYPESIDLNRPNTNSVSTVLCEHSWCDCDKNPDNKNQAKDFCKPYKYMNKEIHSMCCRDCTQPKELNDLNKSDSKELNINTMVSNDSGNADMTNSTYFDSVNLKSDTMGISEERGLCRNIQGDLSTILSSEINTETFGSSLERHNFNLQNDKSYSTGSQSTKPKEEAQELDSGVYVDEKSSEQTGD